MEYSGTDDYVGMYLDEFRLVKGSAVYTGDFDVPISRLTAITNTKLLIHSDIDHVVNQSMAIAGVSDTPTAHGSYPTDAIRFDNGSGEASNNHEIKVNGIDPNVWSGSWTLEGGFGRMELMKVIMVKVYFLLKTFILESCYVGQIIQLLAELI